MAHLLYFINPQIEISPLSLAGVAAVYAMLCGLLFGTILWLAHLGRVRWLEATRQEESARGFGFLAVAVTVSAVVYWGHVLLLRVYLPRGAVRNLSKASTIVAAAALVLFVMWLVERTVRRERLSQVLFAAACALVVVSAFFLYERRERYQPEQRPSMVAFPAAGEPRLVVVIAVRNLPFDWVLQLIGEDLLPFFSRVREESFLTRVEPFPTTSPKTLWASLATGKLPHAHGVTGRFSYRTLINARGQRFLLVPYWVGFKAWGLIPPVERISAQLPAGNALALWSLAERLGNHAVVVNWTNSGSPLSAPRSPIPAAYEALDPSARQTVLDAAGADAAAIAALSRALDGELTLAVGALNGLADAQRALGITANRLPARSTPAGEAIRSYIEQIDRWLAQVESETPGAILIVVSPSGPEPPPLPATPLVLAKILTSQEHPGSSDGFLLIRGANTVARQHAPPASVTDLVPTALFAAGLPIARDMDGRAVAEAFTESFVQQHPMSLIPTYEPEQLVERRAQ